MPRRLRHLPAGGALVEVSCRTLQSRFLLTPSPELNEIIVGVLARAQAQSPVRCCALVFMSSHYHLVLDVDDSEQLSDFMWFANTNLAKEVGRRVPWREKFWGERYHVGLVSHEEVVQRGLLRYLLSHGVKEGLTGSPLEWPGVHCAKVLMTGEPLSGYWFDRTKEGAARRRGESFSRLQYATAETLVLEPIPCWRHLEPEEYRRRIAEMVHEIEQEAARKVAQGGRQPLGAAGVLAQNPLDAPAQPKKSPAPAFHASSKEVLEAMRAEYSEWLRQYRDAAQRLRAGDRAAEFPEDSFPPGSPYVGRPKKPPP